MLLTPHHGIPRHILLMMAIMAGFTVANLYYNQPLLDLICVDTGVTQVEANLITVVTQIGYALGLLFVVPLADMVSVRRIVVLGMSVAAFSALTIGFAENAWMLWVHRYRWARHLLCLSCSFPWLRFIHGRKTSRKTWVT